MIDTRNISRIIMEKTRDVEDDLIEKLNNLEESSIEERYIVDIEEKTIKNLNSLLDYYDKLKTNVDKLNFYKFVLYVMKDEDTTNEFFQELKNLSLLTRTGLLKYAHRQENYSKQVISNFLLKLSKIEENSEDKILEHEIDLTNDKLTNLREYKGYFAPIGIVKEVENSNTYNEFLNTINLGIEEKVDALLMSLSFNVCLHEEKLSMYELDLQKSSEVIRNVFYTSNIDNIKNNYSKRKVNNILKKINKTKKNKKKTKTQEEPTLIEEPILIEEPVLIENISKDEFEEDNIEYKRLEEASKLVKENKDKDPYDLFVNYYDILLGNDLNTDSIKIVEDYLDKNHKLIDNIEPIVKKDLEDTYNIYKENEDLREEIYKTTENIERLLVYEINEIFNNIDVNDSENLVLLTKKVEPIAKYINNNIIKKNKKK